MGLPIENDYFMGFWYGLPSGYDVYSLPRYRWPIEIDGPYRSKKWVGLSMAVLVITRWYIVL